MDARIGALKEKMKRIFFIFYIIIFCIISAFALNPEEEYDCLYKDLRNLSTFGYKDTLDYNTGKSDGTPILTQGRFYQTSLNTDFAINGKGFFKVLDENGKIFYSRYGYLIINTDSRLAIRCNNKIYYLPVEPLPDSYSYEEIRIYSNGNIASKYYTGNNSKVSKVLGTIELYDITADNIKSYDGFVIQTKNEPEKIQNGRIIQGVLEGSSVYLNQTLLRMLFLLEQMDKTLVKCKETKIYIIKHLMETDFQEYYQKLLTDDILGIHNLKYLDGFTVFLERNYK